jgi:hypothetical protein
MSRIKVTKRPRGKDLSRHKEWPVVIYIWAFGLAVFSYVVARIILDGKPHPIHWMFAVIGGLAGIPLGWLWYRWRGDVF